jgi:hypothetical protein
MLQQFLELEATFVMVVEAAQHKDILGLTILMQETQEDYSSVAVEDLVLAQVLAVAEEAMAQEVQAVAEEAQASNSTTLLILHHIDIIMEQVAVAEQVEEFLFMLDKEIG